MDAAEEELIRAAESMPGEQFVILTVGKKVSAKTIIKTELVWE